MPVSQVTPYYGITGIYTYNATSAVNLPQSFNTSTLNVPKAYSVDLSGSALVQSLKLQGLSPSAISIKTGLSLNTVDQYLNISAAPSTAKSTYVPPKKAYSEPKVLMQDREQLAQDLNRLTTEQFAWSNLVGSINKPKSNTLF